MKSPDAIEWEKSTRNEIFPVAPNPTVVNLSTNRSPQGLPDGVITAITKLSDSMIA